MKESSPDNQAAYQHRAERLGVIEEWKLVGRISLDDGDHGGSGRLQWDVKQTAPSSTFMVPWGVAPGTYKLVRRLQP